MTTQFNQKKLQELLAKGDYTKEEFEQTGRHVTYTPKELEAVGQLDQSYFVVTSAARFALDDGGYVENKTVDLDPHLSDFTLEKFVEMYFFDPANQERFRAIAEKEGKIRMIDLGCATGALATLYVLRGLKKMGMGDLLSKIEFTLVDVTDNTVKRTASGNWHWSPEFLKKFGFDGFGEDLKEYKKLLSTARTLVADMADLKNVDTESQDIVLTNFVFHHCGIPGKKAAAKEIERIAKPGALILVGDEYQTLEEHNEWRSKYFYEKNKKGVQMPICDEYFITVDELITYFHKTRVIGTKRDRKHMGFYGERQ